MKQYGWIAVDLDGTLAQYDEWRGEDHIGEPIEKMVRRILYWVEQGIEVKIFTARASNDPTGKIKKIIQNWLVKNGMPKLEITCQKDYGMIECWDDRSVQVIPNTGNAIDGRMF